MTFKTRVRIIIEYNTNDTLEQEKELWEMANVTFEDGGCLADFGVDNDVIIRFEETQPTISTQNWGRS